MNSDPAAAEARAIAAPGKLAEAEAAGEAAMAEAAAEAMAEEAGRGEGRGALNRSS